MIHPHTEPRRVSEELGLGVFATQIIPQGTIVWVLDPFDLRLDPEVVSGYPPILRDKIMHGVHLGYGEGWVMCWDHGRHVNHACRPNCVDVGASFQIASRTLQPGDELTCDYAGCGHVLEFRCRCGNPDCRGWIPAGQRGSDHEHDELASLLALATTLPQPLLPYAMPEPEDAHLLSVLSANPLAAPRRVEVLQ